MSIVGKMSGKDRIMRFKIKCEFIAPVVSFSSYNLVFRCEHEGQGFPESQIKTLTLANISSLDVTAQMTLSQPFFLLNEEGVASSEMLVNVPTGESLHVKVKFLIRVQKYNK